jgi:hypothetical protein
MQRGREQDPRRLFMLALEPVLAFTGADIWDE